jgi:hypothetical protein
MSLVLKIIEVHIINVITFIFNFKENKCLEQKSCYIIDRFYGVTVSTLDFESSNPSSNLGRTSKKIFLH